MRRTIKTVVVDEKIMDAIKRYMIDNDLIFARGLYKSLGFKDYQGFYYFRRKVQRGERIGVSILKRVCDAIGVNYKDFIKEE